MRQTYRILAYLIALGVVVQAASMAYGTAGLIKWVSDGGVLDKAALESETLDFPGLGGVIMHGIGGMTVIPALALLLLVVSFFARVPRGLALAGLEAVLIAVQVLLGMFGHGMPQLAVLHGANALAIVVVALLAARVARPVPAARHAAAGDPAAVAGA